MSKHRSIHWVQESHSDRWRARFDCPDADGQIWEFVVEPRGGMLDALVAAGPEGFVAGTDTLPPGEGPWLWGLGCGDAAGAFRLGGCGAAATEAEAKTVAETLAAGLRQIAWAGLMPVEVSRN